MSHSEVDISHSQPVLEREPIYTNVISHNSSFAAIDDSDFDPPPINMKKKSSKRKLSITKFKKTLSISKN